MKYFSIKNKSGINLLTMMALVCGLVIAATALVSCDDSSDAKGSGTVAVTGVSLDKTTLTLTVGATETLTATVTPHNATNKAVSWSSNAEAIATVSNGAVTGVGPGTATITVTTTDGGKTATCAVTVNAAPITASTVDELKTALAAATGGADADHPIPVTYTGSETWSTSSNGSTALVDALNEAGKYVALTLSSATSLGGWALQKCDYLVEVDLPEVTSVGEWAFNLCSKLTTVNLPKATTTGTGAFSAMYGKGTSLRTVNLPSVISIGGWAFQSCNSLTTIRLGATAPSHDAIFFNITTDITVTVKVPAGAAGYTDDWKTSFIGGNTHVTLVIEEDSE